MSRIDEIKAGLEKINQDLSDSEAQLVAVSKTKPASDIKLAYECGQRVFGENKVQELLDKAQELDLEGIQWHFIGHLQSNKINMLLKTPNLQSIHSIDSIKLLNKLLSKSVGKGIGVFLQVNTSKEDEKSGFETKEELELAVKLLNDHPDFYFQGFMTIGKIRTENFEEDAQKCFQQLVELKHDFSQKFSNDSIELSMGMSSDYPIALKFGANWIRVGSNIFGSRSL
jgi:pyridoxal phosphate enzyme (YggS family)